MWISLLASTPVYLIPFALGIAVACLAGVQKIRPVDGPSMGITKSILCLWFGSAVSSACATFLFGAEHVESLILNSGDYNGGDGPLNISINLPLILVVLLGASAACVALTGFILSWTLNKQPFGSRPHLACLLFLLPLALGLLVRSDF
ncbi:MAG TPA: hypothetical protein VH280_00675 [Verrucomicrobiae bacterium]|jgi:hypothetical protein|nr:hypothetical protein [Verrucomicrobiae bacterium]